MTRGTFYLFLPDKVITSCEFNGGMYGNPQDDKELQEYGNYRLAVKKLKKVKDKESFEKVIREFDREAEFNYQDEHGDYFRFYEFDIKDFLIGKSGDVDMREKNYYKLFFSDYIYLKNLTGKDLRVRGYDGEETAIVPNGKIATFHFGRFIEII